MVYTHLNFDAVVHRERRKVFNHVSMLLSDSYGILKNLPPKDHDGGGGNFSVALILLCVIDGLAAEVWPRRVLIPTQEQRFKRLIRDRLHWGPEGKGKWLQKGVAADQLYNEFRNPLVHVLGSDRAAASRPIGFGEPAIGKWGKIPSSSQDVEAIDALATWNDDWPIIGDESDRTGTPRLKLSVVALYWAVKQLANEMLKIETGA